MWAACLFLFFYLSTTEFSHCQPDVWMLLPALAALALRIRQADRVMHVTGDTRRVAGAALAEGICWGLAVLFKPPVLLPALACLLLSTAWALVARPRSVRKIVADFAGLHTGGLLVGGVTVGWMTASGNWPHFVEAAFGGWAGEYYRHSPNWIDRTLIAFLVPWPWGLAHLAAIPLAFLSVGTSFRLVSQHDPDRNRPALGLALLSVCYLAWFIQANFIQQQLPYHQVPAVFLALAVLVGHARLSDWGRRGVSPCSASRSGRGRTPAPSALLSRSSGAGADRRRIPRLRDELRSRNPDLCGPESR
jgi:hypothetical protein